MACPNCGYPIREIYIPVVSKVEYKPQRARKKHKKLPNGYGSIKKLTGRRTKPFAVYPPTKEYAPNGSPKTGPAIGYYEDWYTAFDALREYNQHPYDIEKSQYTFADVYHDFYRAKSNRILSLGFYRNFIKLVIGAKSQQNQALEPILLAFYM